MSFKSIAVDNHESHNVGNPISQTRKHGEIHFTMQLRMLHSGDRMQRKEYWCILLVTRSWPGSFFEWSSSFSEMATWDNGVLGGSRMVLPFRYVMPALFLPLRLYKPYIDN